MGEEEREARPQFNIDMELEGKNWAPSLTPASDYEVDKSPDEIPEDRDYTKNLKC